MLTPHSVFGLFDTPWGRMAAARTRVGLSAVSLPGEGVPVLVARYKGLARDDGAFADLADQVTAYFAGDLTEFDLPLDLSRQTEFTRMVLEELRTVGVGETLTYGGLAARVGRPGAARAIGGAMSRNPLPLVIPCHRVVGGSGLCGFSGPGGTDLKQRLLDWEAAAAPAAPMTALDRLIAALAADTPAARTWAFAAVCIVTAAVCGLLASAGALPQCIYPEDAVIPLDGAWRIVCGRRPHADFYSPLGALWMLPIAAFLGLNPSADALAYAAAFWTAVFSLWTWQIARTRMSAAGAALLAVCNGLLAGGAHNLGGAWENSAYAMAYNRLGFALITVLFIGLFLPRRDGPAGRADALGLGAALAGLLLCKLNFFAVGVAAVAMRTVLRRPPTRRLAEAAGTFLAVMLAFLAWQGFDPRPFLADMAMVGAAQDWTARIDGLRAAAAGNAGLIVMSLAAALLTLGPSWRRAAGSVCVASAGVVLCGTNYQKGGIPLLALAGLLAVERLLRDAAAPPDRRPRAARLRLAAAMALTAVLLIPTAVADALGIVRAAAWAMTHAADVPEAMRLQSPALRTLIVLPTHSRRGAETLEFRDAVNDGLALLRRHVQADDRVAVLDFVNPFNFALGLHPPVGSPLWWDKGKTFGSAAHPSADRAFGGCTLLMIPRTPPGTPHPTRDALLEIYGEYLRGRFTEIDAGERWRLLRRKG